MAKLGYTWYPKDWKTNEKVFNLSLELRGFYREFIDYAYENDNRFVIEHRFFCRMLNIKKRKFDTLLDRLLQENLIIKVSNLYQIPTVEPRIQLIRGGRKGGKKSKPTPKPNRKPILKPDSKQREREIKENIKERKLTFKKTLLTFKNYDKELLKAFYDYWTEHNPNGKKMRFEMEKVFDTSRRLSNWKRQSNKFNKPVKQERL